MASSAAATQRDGGDDEAATEGGGLARDHQAGTWALPGTRPSWHPRPSDVLAETPWQSLKSLRLQRPATLKRKRTARRRRLAPAPPSFSEQRELLQ